LEAKSATLLKTPLHVACEGTNKEVVKLLIETGCDPNIRDFDHNTPLHCASASENGSLEIIAYLLEETQANPNIRNKFGLSPSDIAYNLEVRQVFD